MTANQSAERTPDEHAGSSVKRWVRRLSPHRSAADARDIVTA